MNPVASMLRGAVLLLFAASAPALTIDETGAPGAPGEDGESIALAGETLAVPGAEVAELSVLATGGEGGEALPGGAAGHGGSASLGRFLGVSETGTVLVTALARGGSGGNASEADELPGDGGSVRLRDAVDGETAGRLVLAQQATGGAYGFALGSEGRGGNARSTLHREKWADSLSLHSAAAGGGPQRAVANAGGVGTGGNAHAEVHGFNGAGEVSVIGSATGGAGAAAVSGSEQAGGDARVVASARTRGDGHPVRVGAAPFRRFPAGGERPTRPLPGDDPGALPTYRGPVGELGVLLMPATPRIDPFGRRRFIWWPGFGARGGDSNEPPLTGRPPAPGMPPAPRMPPPGGSGGSARSVSLGVAEGDSEVAVYDSASGGKGGSDPLKGAAAAGGRARSAAVALGGGASPVVAAASATGGEAGPYPTTPSGAARADGRAGGPASASAFATGGGPVSASAEARGASGRADAVATALGRSGHARALAGSLSQALQVEVGAESEVARGATVEARIAPERRRARRTRLARGRHAAARDAVVEASVDPHRRETRGARRALGRALAEAGASDLAAVGVFHSGRQQGGGVVTTALEIDLENPYFARLIPPPTVFIGLFAPRLRGAGVEGLRVTLWKDAEILLDESFPDPDAGVAFLDGALLDVGAIALAPPGPLPNFPLPPASQVVTLRIEFDTRERGAGLDLGFAVATRPPE